jgi:DNA replication protein DnaC
MLENQTIQKLRAMKLKVMAQMLAEPDNMLLELTFEERFGIMIENEWQNKRNAKINRLIGQATLGTNATLEDIDYGDYRKIDKSLVRTLSTCAYIEQKLNVLISGKTGSGKSFLACALGNQACRKEHAAKYYRIPELLLDLDEAKSQNRYQKFLRSFEKYKLLILDDFGAKIYTQEECRDLLEFAERRYNKTSTIFVSQLPDDKWYELFADPTDADAFLDRIIHNSYNLPLDSKVSLREVSAKQKLKMIDS